jgi:hypothetical protein
VLAAIKLGYSTVDDAFEYLLAHPEMKLSADKAKEEEAKKQQEEDRDASDELGESTADERTDGDWLYIQNQNTLLDEPTWPMPRQSDAPYHAPSSDALGYLYLQAQAALPSLWRIAVEAAAAAWCEEETHTMQEDQDEEEVDDDSTDTEEEPILVHVTRLPLSTLWKDHMHVLQAVKVGLKGVHRAVKKAWRLYNGDVHHIVDLVGCLQR